MGDFGVDIVVYTACLYILDKFRHSKLMWLVGVVLNLGTFCKAMNLNDRD